MNILKPIIFVIVITNLIIVSSCNGILNKTGSSETSDSVEVDSFEIKREIERKEIAKIMKADSIDYYFDSLKFEHSIDADSILSKKVLIYECHIDDVYKDANGYHVLIGRFDSFIRLNCTKEQAEFIRDDTREYQFYSITFTPNYIRRINQELVANAELEGEDDIDSYMTIDEIRGMESFIIKGSLIKITPLTVY
jgi:hypothetical protein